MAWYSTAKLIPAFIIGCALVTAMSCHKKNSTNPVVTAPYAFIITGNTLAGYALSFQSTAPVASTFLWSFGDGTTSTEAYPSHTYNHIDSFTITLTVNNTTNLTVSKTIYIATPPNPANLSGIGGMKYWHGYVIAGFQSATMKDTITTITDQFPVSLLDNVTIVAKDDTLDCYYTDAVNHVYYFHHVFSQYSWREIAYYYNTNSYFYIYYPDQGGDPQTGPFSSPTVLWTP